MDTAEWVNQSKSALQLPRSSDDGRSTIPQSLCACKLAKPCSPAHLREQYNPTGVVFPKVDTVASCGCNTSCRAGTCVNARMGVYCTINCCPFEGLCGNGLQESNKIVLTVDTQTRQHAVIATETIQAGVVIGQYLGKLFMSIRFVKRGNPTTVIRCS